MAPPWTRPSPTVGEMPLPPYIAGKRGTDEQDTADYQTIFAEREGAVAAPTAGLHFTPQLMKRLQEAGIAQEFVTLHVGAGTFLPVKAEDTQDHKMHAEWGEVTAATCERLKAARAPRAAASWRWARPRSACSRASGSRALLGHDGYLHHAGLPVPRRRSADDQFPPAEVDAVHAGLGLRRAGARCGRPMPMPSPTTIGSIPMATPACYSPRHDH